MSSHLENLLAHSSWIRGLARHLARDGQTADDLVQDAWVVALRHGPDAGGDEPSSLRRWAANVLRNLARQKRRGESRRAEHEERAARSAELPPDGLPDALVERLDEQEALAAAVRGLDEPYRAAILLRYYEGLSPGEIANRLGVPLRTVHTRLNRALHRLRAKLGTDQDGRTWSILALPRLGALKNGVPAALSGGLIVKTKLEIAIGVAALVGVAALGVWWLERPSKPANALAAKTVMAEELTLPSGIDDLAPAVEQTTRRAAVDVSAPPSTGPTQTPRVQLVPTRGVVIDARGTAVAGVDVTFVPARDAQRRTVASDGQGRFAFDESLPTGELIVATEGWTTIMKPMLWRMQRPEQYLLVVAPSHDLAGTVVDASGASIDGARVELRLSPDLRVEFGQALELSSAEHWRTESDELGRFELPAAPEVSNSRLLASKAGYRSASREAPSTPAYDLELVLEKGDEARLLRGTVVDGTGAPVSAAHVALGWSGTRTDERGAFTIDFPGATETEDGLYQEPDRLWVVATERLPASVQRRGFSNTAPDAWPDPLRIVLDGAAASIAGRVVDADDTPLAGIRVRSEDRTPFGAVHDEGGGVFENVSVESLATGNVGDVFVMTDREGRFELGGLLARDYRLSALDAESLRFALSDPIAAGEVGVVLRLPRGEEVLLFSGRVAGLDGTPLPGVTVIPGRDCVLPDGTRQRVEGNQANRTDAFGRFAIEGLKAVPDRIEVRGAAVFMSAAWEIPSTADLAELEVAVTQARRFRVHLDEPGDARWFEVLDAESQELDLVSLQGNVGYMSSTWRLVDGRTEVITVSELARTLVLRGTEGELRRIPLDFVPGGVVTVR